MARRIIAALLGAAPPVSSPGSASTWFFCKRSFVCTWYFFGITISASTESATTAAAMVRMAAFRRFMD